MKTSLAPADWVETCTWCCNNGQSESTNEWYVYKYFLFCIRLCVGQETRLRSELCRPMFDNDDHALPMNSWLPHLQQQKPFAPLLSSREWEVMTHSPMFYRAGSALVICHIYIKVEFWNVLFHMLYITVFHAEITLPHFGYTYFEYGCEFDSPRAENISSTWILYTNRATSHGDCHFTAIWVSYDLTIMRCKNENWK